MMNTLLWVEIFYKGAFFLICYFLIHSVGYMTESLFSLVPRQIHRNGQRPVALVTQPMMQHRLDSVDVAS